MEMVVNEWLLEYLCPDAKESNTNLAIRFVNAWVTKCDKVVIRRPSPFVTKFYRYWQKFGQDTDFKKRFSKLNQLLFINSDKTVIADDSDIKKLKNEVEAKTPSDDKYLIELAYSEPDRIVVTTDRRLKDKLQGEANLKIYLLEEFLHKYSVEKIENKTSPPDHG